MATEILRLTFEARLFRRQRGRACGASCSTLADAAGRFQAARPRVAAACGAPRRGPWGRASTRVHGELASDAREPGRQRVHAERAVMYGTLSAVLRGTTWVPSIPVAA